LAPKPKTPIPYPQIPKKESHSNFIQRNIFKSQSNMSFKNYYY
jgi:hypothetical protein